MRNQSFPAAIQSAVEGIISAVIVERSVRIELVIFAFALALSWLLKITSLELVIILFISLAVFVCELINSSIEALADGCHPDYSEHIARAKNMSAGAVLMVSLAALIIGLIILGPRLINLVY